MQTVLLEDPILVAIVKIDSVMIRYGQHKQYGILGAYFEH